MAERERPRSVLVRRAAGWTVVAVVCGLGPAAAWLFWRPAVGPPLGGAGGTTTLLVTTTARPFGVQRPIVLCDGGELRYEGFYYTKAEDIGRPNLALRVADGTPHGYGAILPWAWVYESGKVVWDKSAFPRERGERFERRLTEIERQIAKEARPSVAIPLPAAAGAKIAAGGSVWQIAWPAAVYDVVCTLGPVAFVLSLWRSVRAWRVLRTYDVRTGRLRCRRCGYDLVGLSVDRCPECGRAVAGGLRGGE